MEALVFGTLVVVDGCIRIIADESGESYLLIWPPHFSLSGQSNEIKILNETGSVAAHVGDQARISGGETRTIDHLGQSAVKAIPPECGGPYWVVGNEFEKTP